MDTFEYKAQDVLGVFLYPASRKRPIQMQRSSDWELL